MCQIFKRRHNAMSIPLSQLLASLSVAVQKANEAVDAFAAESYLEQGYDPKSCADQNGGQNNGPMALTPRTVAIAVPGEQETSLNVPVTALMSHHTLQLDEVSMTLKIALREGDAAEPLVVVDPGVKDNVSEIELHFKSAPPAEGAARIQDRNIRSAFS